jgi:hypothetical protein
MVKTPEDPAGIGHNQGPPLNLSGSWAGYCWVRARREVWDNPPIEVVRRRLRRANELGLSYRQYTGIQLDKGVRTEALVFDLSSLGRPAPQPMTLSAPRAAFAPTPAPSVDEVIERMASKCLPSRPATTSGRRSCVSPSIRRTATSAPISTR